MKIVPADPDYKSLRAAPRVDLAQTSPLSAPFTIYVEPTNVCNFGCKMCPESLPDYAERAGYYQKMDLGLFDKLVADIKELGGVKSLKLYFEGEPLLNNELEEMIVRGRTVAERTELTTNGSMLSSARSRKIIASGLDYLQVSIYSVMDSDHHRITGQGRTSPRDILRNIQLLVEAREELCSEKPHIHAKLMYDSEEGRVAFEYQYQNVADSISVQGTHNWTGTIDHPSPLVNISEAPVNIKNVCPFPFYMLTVKANGDVSVCCVDWSGALVIGNVGRNSLREIWEGEKLREIRLQHLSGNRKKVFSVCELRCSLYLSGFA
jgi:MoaA/NifB/PqqE/SkfB family radical SAM enzyme